jgi:hypothetical protein
MRFENSKQLYSYWLNLKGERKAPDRSEIEPSDIRSLLGDTFILEVNHDAKYIIYRLAGTRLCSAFGKEIKGMGYLVPWQEEDNFKVLQAINNVYSGNVPCVISHLGLTEQRRFMEYETLLLPLLPLKDGTTRIFGISSPKKEAFWIGSEPIVTHTLRSIRSVVQNREKFKDDNLILSPPMQHEGSPHENVPNPDGTRKFAHLVVHKGGKT